MVQIENSTNRNLSMRNASYFNFVRLCFHKNIKKHKKHKIKNIKRMFFTLLLKNKTRFYIYGADRHTTK